MAVGKGDRPHGEFSVPTHSLWRGFAPLEFLSGILRGAVKSDFSILDKLRSASTNGGGCHLSIRLFGCILSVNDAAGVFGACFALKPSRIQCVAAPIGFVRSPVVFYGEMG